MSFGDRIRELLGRERPRPAGRRGASRSGSRERERRPDEPTRHGSAGAPARPPDPPIAWAAPIPERHPEPIPTPPPAPAPSAPAAWQRPNEPASSNKGESTVYEARAQARSKRVAGVLVSIDGK